MLLWDMWSFKIPLFSLSTIVTSKINTTPTFTVSMTTSFKNIGTSFWSRFHIIIKSSAPRLHSFLFISGVFVSLNPWRDLLYPLVHQHTFHQIYRLAYHCRYRMALPTLILQYYYIPFIFLWNKKFLKEFCN